MVGPNLKPINSIPTPQRRVVTGPRMAFELIGPMMRKDQEELWVMALSPGKRVIGLDAIFRGTVDQCLVHPRDLIRFVCQHNASSFLIAHNHPSGEVEVSECDWQLTQRLLDVSRLIQIPMDDHIVIAWPNYVSLRQRDPSMFQFD